MEITATAADQPRRVRACFTDNGMEIPEMGRARVFGLFERFHPERSGTGIGLAIAHRAIERLHGKIGVEPSAHGAGTRFWIELPSA